MSKILYFECLSGISGDMTIGALLDLGVDFDLFKTELKKLNLDGYHVVADKKSKNGIYGTKFDVILDNEEHHHTHGQHHDHGEHHDHEQHHDHGDYHHKHGEHHDHAEHHHESDQHTHSHHHRNLTSITAMINNSDLSEDVKDLSVKIFNEVAVAEAKIHNTSLDEVHFHEVGAIDSIIDIVGTAILIEMLGIKEIYASPVHVGTGFVKCDHGKIPVPAPATLEILKGIPIYSKGIRSELVTPTGAAIIKSLAIDFVDRPEMVIENTGYGIATKDLEIANLLRVSVAKKKIDKDIIWQISCNIDDMVGEVYSYLMERLFSQGALDVTYTSIQMKKNRPGVMVSVLVTQELLSDIENILLTETTTFGIRKIRVERSILERTFRKIITPFGPLDIKFGHFNGKLLKATPEYEICRKLALENNLPIKDVYNVIHSVIEKELKDY